MTRIVLPQLSDSFSTAVARGDRSLEKAIRNLNKVTLDFHDAFSESHEIVAWSSVPAVDQTPELHALIDLSALHILVGKRIAELLWDLVECLERRRLTLAALAARATIETCAVAVYSEERVVPALRDGQHGALIAFLHQITAGARFDWERLRSTADDQRAMLRQYAAAKSAKDQPEPTTKPKAINVLTMLGRLDARTALDAKSRGIEDGEGVLLAEYAMLSDFCHPSVGGNALHQHPAAGGSRIRLHSDVGDDLLRWFFETAGIMVAPTVRVARLSLIAIREAAETLAKPKEQR